MDASGHSPTPKPTPTPHLTNIQHAIIMGTLATALVVVLAVFAWLIIKPSSSKAPSSSAVASGTAAPTSSTAVGSLVLNTSHHYGNKYVNGILPVGDGKYVTTGPKQGYIYACQQYATSLSQNPGGNYSTRPWIINNNTEYDSNSKLHVSGSVSMTPQYSMNLSGTTRVITTNDIPSHPVGVYPISSSDPVYAYDHNPNAIQAQNFTFNLPANPAFGAPNCIGNEVGVMTTGVVIFNALDAGGRDAGAWEAVDACGGHPQQNGVYHYHTLSPCIKNTSVHHVIGFALDGFPITGPVVGPNNILTTADLDVCHGITSQIDLGGKSVTMYHYVMTQDYPYSVSCFRGHPIQPPGQAGPAGGSSGNAPGNPPLGSPPPSS